jgi:opacity protein-like surface antigen
MRTKVFVFALMMAFGFSSFAQNDSKLHFGLKVSPTLAWFKSDTKDVTSDGSKLGFAYGLMTDFAFTPNYVFATGVDVTYRGGKIKSADTSGNSVSINYTLQYIEIPLTLKLKTNEIGYITYFGKFGFAPGINIKAQIDGENGKSGIEPINIAFIVGLGAEYSLGGKTSLMGGITFNNGFVDVVKSSDLKLTTNFISLDIGLFF